MIEEQIDRELLVSGLKAVLAAHEREADAEFQLELPQMFQQTTLEVPLVGFRTESQEIETVWVFRDLLGEIGLRCRQRTVEVRNGFAYTYWTRAHPWPSVAMTHSRSTASFT